MTISAEIILDSTCYFDTAEGDRAHEKRIVTFALRYPRFIHAELMTHRVFSRNASSSRAIPVERMMDFIVEDTAKPIHWGKNQKGMQAREEIDTPIIGDQIFVAPDVVDLEEMTPEEAWNAARNDALKWASRFHAAGYHKQIVNRILEPFSHINVLVTATEWDNWFELRDHPDAQPEIAELARQMRKAMEASTPKRLNAGEWHLPYITQEDRMRCMSAAATMDGVPPIELQRRVSAARCARVSYKTFDGGTPTVEADLKLFDKLAAGRPLHASPLEHQAMALHGSGGVKHPAGGEPIWHESSIRYYQRNFRGWLQYRAFWEDQVFG